MLLRDTAGYALPTTPLLPRPFPDGIERYDDGEQCARCGSSVSWADCWSCGGEGYVEEDDDCGASPFREIYTCSICLGTGGRLHCISSPEWCNANPQHGREHVQSSALRSWD